MAPPSPFTSPSEEKGTTNPHESYLPLIQTLPLNQEWPPFSLHHYNGFWIPSDFTIGAMAMRDSFVPRSGDIIIASHPKSGTTWLKALAVAAATRSHYPLSDHPLRRFNPHDLVPSGEALFTFTGDASMEYSLPPPRILSVHLPFELLPETMTAPSSGCRIIYAVREPKDNFVSLWCYGQKLVSGGATAPALEKAVELFCEGKSFFGPVWEHMLGYWLESRRRPEKVLFLKYEEMVEDAGRILRKIAEFIGCPFSPEEEAAGVVDEMVNLCSFESLSSVEETKTGSVDVGSGVVIKKSFFFRKGRVGDWKNYLTEEMARKMDAITDKKLEGSGLIF